MAKHRPGARPARAGKAPKNNPPRGTGGRNKPNTGSGNRGGTGRPTQHKSSFATPEQIKVAWAVFVVAPALVVVTVLAYLVHGYAA